MKKNRKTVVETHGKDEQSIEPTLLEQVWSQVDISRYGTLIESEYMQRINQMTRADLETHARQMGVVVVENSFRLRDKLLAEFRGFVALINKPKIAPRSNFKINDAALKVLSEGR